MKESTKIRLFALAAALTLGMFGCAFSQDVKARSFRDEVKKEYDSKKYFNLAFIISSSGELEQTDSVQILIREKDSKEASLFTVCEKTDLYFAYDKCYIVLIHRKGYETVQLCVNAGVKVMEYGTFIPVDLKKGTGTKSIGLVVWDSRIDNIHYYPEGGSFL